MSELAISLIVYILNYVEFEWDTVKAAKNLEKHGVSFDEAASSFSDPDIIMGHDLSHSKAEDRYVAVAKSERGQVLVTIFTIRRVHDSQKIHRIISSRPANQKERKAYPRS